MTTATATKPMAMIVDREMLQKALVLLMGCIKGRTPRPELQCVHIRAKGRELILSATDAEASMRLPTAQVDVHTEGECLVPADRLAAIVGACSSPTLKIEKAEEGDGILVAGDAQRYLLYGYPPAGFPPLPDFYKVKTDAATRAVFSVPLSTLVRGIGMVDFAAKTAEMSRYSMRAVLMKTAGKTVELVASDGRRLALHSFKLAAAAKSVAALLPLKAAALLTKLPDYERAEPDADVAIEVCITENQILARTAGGVELSTAMIEGAFPPYEEVIPKDNPIKVVVNRRALGEAIRAARVMTNEESQGVRFKFSAADKAIELSSVAPERGSATIGAKSESHEGDDAEVAMNGQFALDALEASQSESVEIRIKAASRPVLFTALDYQCVVMPVHL